MFDSVDFDELHDYPVALLGPLLNGYFAALYERYEGGGVPTIGFVSREGVFLNEAFRAFCDARGLTAASVAVPASRALLSKLLLDDGSLEHIIKAKFKGSFARLLADRAAIYDWTDSADMISWSKTRFELPRDADQVTALWPHIRDRIAPRITEKKNAYKAFLQDVGFTGGSIVADVGYSGSLQALLSWILEEPLDSFYIATTTKQKVYHPDHGGKFEGLFDRIGAIGEGPAILDNSLLLEVMMSANHGQVDDYEPTPARRGWRFRHGPKGRSQYAHDIIRIMQDAVIRYIRDSLAVDLNVLNSVDHRQWLYRYTNRMMSSPSMAPKLLIEIGDVDDRASGLGFINPWRILPKFR